MYVISSFEHSVHLELAITGLEHKGIDRKDILAVPLDKRKEETQFFDTINQSDGVSLFDLALVLGTAFMVVGTIYGYVLKWGPILWALIGFFLGAVIGFFIDLIPKGRSRRKKGLPNKTGEVVVIVHCDQSKVEMVEGILWGNWALGLARLDHAPT